MGKVRIKTLGVEGIEEKQKQDAKKRKVEKQAKKLAKGAHGGERLVLMAPSEEELAHLETPKETKETKAPEGEKTKARPKRLRGKQYREKLALVDRKRLYPLPDALELLRKVGFTKFDGTVELHINTIDKGINASLVLPHGTGKKTTVAIADDKLIEEVDKGKISFDVLLATPAMMPKLARVAKILGPRGLMPNPKNGTISNNPERLALSFAKGQINFKTESQAPIIHLTVGKLSMEDKKLADNIQAVLSAIGSEKIKNVTLKSTMSPGIRINFN